MRIPQPGKPVWGPRSIIMLGRAKLALRKSAAVAANFTRHLARRPEDRCRSARKLPTRRSAVLRNAGEGSALAELRCATCGVETVFLKVSWAKNLVISGFSRVLFLVVPSVVPDQLSFHFPSVNNSIAYFQLFINRRQDAESN